MDTLSAVVRKFVFDHFLEHAARPVVEQLMTEFSLARDEATDVLRGLEAARQGPVKMRLGSPGLRPHLAAEESELASCH